MYPTWVYLLGQATIVLVWSLAGWLLLRRPIAEAPYARARAGLALVAAFAGSLWLGSIVRTFVWAADGSAVLDDPALRAAACGEHLDCWIGEVLPIYVGLGLLYGLPLACFAFLAAWMVQQGRSRWVWVPGGLVAGVVIVLTLFMFLTPSNVVWRMPLSTNVNASLEIQGEHR